MTVANDMSLLTLITGASLPVQLVMAILLITSIFSWWYIFIKVATIGRAEKESEEFENAFWSGGDLNKLYDGVGDYISRNGIGTDDNQPEKSLTKPLNIDQPIKSS